jgi:hypothetical protein
MPDPGAARRLAGLARLRRFETEAARRDLAHALTDAADLDARAARIDAAIAAARADPVPLDRDGFAAWMMALRLEQTRLAQERAAMEARIAAARDALTRRRRRETVTAGALTAVMMEERLAAEGRARTELEDLVRAGRRGVGWG